MKLREYKDIYLGMLVLMILGTFLSSQIFFLISVGYSIVLLIRNHFEMMIPKIPGFKMYVIMIGYGACVGCMLYNFRDVIRDMYYVLPTILWIFIGYNVYRCEKNENKDIFKTIFLYGSFISVKAIIVFLLGFSISFDKFRNVFGANVYDVGFILPITVMQIFLYGKTYISKGWDCLFTALMFVQIILSFGRVAILEPLIVMFVLMLITAMHNLYPKKMFIMAVTLLTVLIIGIFVLNNILPETITEVFVDKISGTFDEINMNQHINSVASAMNNWRAYEIQAAQQQWLNSNILNKIWGEGMGKGIEIQYVPYSWKGIVVNGEIPLLHNGFYSILIKCGLFGLVSLIQMFMGTAYLGVKKAKADLNNGYAIILIGISIAAIANTYVVRGPIQQGTFLAWALLVGWINGYLRRT